ncbi:M24 family metallopeptidase [Kiloniella sp.]|uniref:M24 family metallopeptidase n=1 Tax=Kiloniella sp. TaxID=1938587 RepID=UPI003B01402C
MDMKNTPSGSGQLFGRHRRKIAPFEIPEHPGPNASHAELEAWARSKAANFNQHVIGYGALAEGEWKAAKIPEPDLGTMRRYRLERIREQLRARDLAGIYLYDPLNVRYATDASNMQLWTLHNPVRACFVATDGPVILYDFHNCEHLSDHSEVVDEVHAGIAWFYFEAGNRVEEQAAKWAKITADLVHQHGGGNKRLAFDQVDSHGIPHLNREGIEVIYGEDVMEEARKIKSPDEILCMRRAVVACEAAMSEMEKALRPGMSENDLWSILHAENIRRGGEWIETRLLASGPRTNPWFQESSARVIEAGDLVAFDTDLIGSYGFCCDISRTWLAGDGKPSNEQRALYQMALEQIDHNREMLAPGVSFKELSHQGKSLPEEYLPNRYSVLFHGVGLCDEYPAVRYPSDWESVGYEGELEPGMVVCVESYVGRHGGHEGVKLEDQILITDTGYEQLSSYPLDERLMGKI